MDKNKLTLLTGVLLLAWLIAGTGCASKGFVREEIAAMDDKVAGVESSVEENQKRIKEHDERLASLGSLITQSQSDLEAHKADTDSRLTEVKKMAQGKLIFQETLRNEEAKFKFDSAELSDEAKVALDGFVQTLIAEDRGVYLEIQGHTDSTGEDSVNLSLGKRRAQAVMEYLHKQYRIPLHRMEVISYGSAQPIADNATRDGRSQNRRVVILVYE
jgi:outer membrane protein OmpA-like peptidoglycan-associated protein